MQSNNNQEAFFALLRAGLWEQEVRLESLGPIDFGEVYRLAEQQSVVGIVAAGLEHVIDTRIPKEDALTFAGAAVQLEQRNVAMNSFVADLIQNLRSNGVYTLLVKGQGLAQCYERPLWRTCGDVDLFLSKENYDKAKDYLVPLASHIEEEENRRQHLGMIIEQWEVELHGTLYGRVGKKVNKGLDDIKDDIFNRGQVRLWLNRNTQIFLPGADNDVVIVFTHILQHFFEGGIGLRQVCDWCRLLWTYKDSIDLRQLGNRLESMGVMTEWKALATLAVDYLGMPREAMLLYSDEIKWSKKAEKILTIILETGNFGHNRDNSYRTRHFYLVMKFISLWRNTKDSVSYFVIFPVDAIRTWFLRLGESFRLIKAGR